MPSYNKVLLMGHMTRDPELRYTPKGKALAQFGMAVNRKWKAESGEQQEEVLFIDCTAWGRTAEVLNQYKKKGDPLMVDGRLKLDQWEDKQTGAKRSKISVVIETMQCLDRADGGERPERQPAPAKFEPSDNDGALPPPEDNIPF
jgi:single-strand DNA-binding protein